MAAREDPDPDTYYAEASATEIFSGPTHDLIPSSYSSFHHHAPAGRARSRSRSYSRRDSRRDSSVSRSSRTFDRPPSIRSLQSQALDDDDGGRRSPEPGPHFSFFSREEVKHAEGGSTVPEDEPEEFYGSGDDDDGDSGGGGGGADSDAEAAGAAARLRGRSPRTSHGAAAQRPFFDQYSDDEPLLGGAHEVEREFAYPSARLRQRYYIAEEDLRIVCAGYKRDAWRRRAYLALCVLTLGLGYLVLRWFPRRRIAWLARECPLGNADLLVVENQWGDLELVDVHSTRYDFPLSTVFNLASGAGDASEDEGGANGAGGAGSSAAGADGYAAADDDAYAYVDKDPNVPYLRTVSYRYLRFHYNPVRDLFMTNSDWVNPGWAAHADAQNGLDGDVQDRRETVFGPNALDIRQPSAAKLLVDEVLHPFYIFQVFSIILWAFDDFMYYATAILLVSAGSVLEALFETKRNLARLADITRFEAEVRVLRSGFWVTLPARELVPGDVYELSDPQLTALPCDSVLLTGDCIVNESILTGESVPVAKAAADDAVLELLVAEGPSEVAGSFLYGGTKLIRVRKPVSRGADVFEGALAMVVRTGFSTTKGSLVRSMLFPRPSGFKFYRDSFRYIGVMAVVAALGFLVSLASFVRMHLSAKLIVLRALDLITIVVPPALPATLTIGTNISLARLRKKQIFCITPSRANVGGRIDVVCFDKTGTLTADGLDVLGVHVFDKARRRFSPLHASAAELGPGPLLATLATCHDLREIDGKLVGDPLDVKMFELSGWNFSESTAPGAAPGVAHGTRVAESPDGRQQFHVAKQFEFVSALRRMSVVVTASGAGTETDARDGAARVPHMQLLVKGAPEVMRDICRPETLAPDFDEVLHEYTHRGYRVIACAARPLDAIADYDRAALERDLDFTGFIIFENRLKPATAGVIETLNKARIRTVMCTGDNLLTAVSVGRKCGILEADQKVFAAHFTENPVAPLRWECVDDPHLILDDETLAPLGARGPRPGEYVLAVSGDVFGWLMRHGTDRQVDQMLVLGAIYARMSPDEKHELVAKLKRVDYTTCFCGDGANDVGALKEADVGISLSEAEASVAAPFTSRVFEISCVTDVIREGRCALTTSFSCFQFMSLYSAIQFISVSILYAYGSNLGDFQFLWDDLFLIVPLAAFMAWSEPADQLTVKRPNAKLVGRKVLVPLLGTAAILGVFQAFGWRLVHHQPWYIAPEAGNNDNLKSSDNTALFTISCFQYIMVAWILCRGPPYRKPVYTNRPFLFTVLACLLFSVLFVFLDPDTSFGDLMDLSPTSTSFKFAVLAIALVNFGVLEFAEKLLFTPIERAIAGAKRALRVSKTRKRYKVLLEANQVA